MKRILTTLLLCAMCIASYAQEHNHIKFLGHYIDEPGYISTLKKEGKIKYVGEDLYEANVCGDDVFIFFMTIRNTDKIYCITFSKKDSDGWNGLKSTYFRYKELFSQKYNLLECIERSGVSPTLTESDYALKNIKEGNGLFNSIFEIPNGYLFVKIINTDNEHRYPEYGSVAVTYVDKANSELNKSINNKAQLDDL